MAKVTAEFKADFDTCMDYWKSLKDGFTDDDVKEAKTDARAIIQEDDKERINLMDGWFSREAQAIRQLSQQASGINERIQAQIELDVRKAA